MTTKEALRLMDPEDDAQWTSDGLPLVDVVRGLAGNEALTRRDITEADPAFCRDTAKVKDVVPDVVPVPMSRDDAFRAEQKQLELEIAELSQKQHNLGIEMAVKQQRWYQLQAHFDRQNSTASDTQNRLTYIKKQNQLREERVTRSRDLLKGIDLRQLGGKAPIDEAMSRKNTRGTLWPIVTPEQPKE